MDFAPESDWLLPKSIWTNGKSLTPLLDSTTELPRLSSSEGPIQSLACSVLALLLKNFALLCPICPAIEPEKGFLALPVVIGIIPTFLLRIYLSQPGIAKRIVRIREEHPK